MCNLQQYRAELYKNTVQQKKEKSKQEKEKTVRKIAIVSRETICDRGDGYVSPAFLISKSAMHQKNTVASPRLWCAAVLRQTALFSNFIGLPFEFAEFQIGNHSG